MPIIIVITLDKYYDDKLHSSNILTMLEYVIRKSFQYNKKHLFNHGGLDTMESTVRACVYGSCVMFRHTQSVEHNCNQRNQ